MTAKVKEFVCLEKRKNDLDAELKQVEQDLKTLERVVVNEMVNAGFDEGRGRWPRSLKLVPDVYASPVKDREARRGRAQGVGTRSVRPGELQRLSTRAASSRRSLPKCSRRAQDEERVASAEDIRAALPEPLGRALKISLGHKLSSRKA